jgi:hypothetical protein
MKLNHLAIAIALASVPVIVFNQAQASINVFLDKNALKKQR